MIQDLRYAAFPEGAPAITMLEQIGLHLTTNAGYVQKYVSAHFPGVLGDFQTAELLAQNAHLISQATVPLPTMEPAWARGMTRTHVNQSLLLLQSLWLVKDNSVNAGRVYFAARRMHGADLWTHDTPPYSFFTANCALQETAFSRSELDEAIALYRSFSENSRNAPYNAYSIGPSAAAVESRIGRALLIVRSARSVDDIGLKVAFYCVAFEAILSTSKDAVAHQIAERTAIMVGGATDKIAIYRDMKTLYDKRSKVLHGGRLDAADVRALQERVSRCDGYLRKVLRRLLAEEDLKGLFTRGTSEAIGKYFLDRLLPPTETTE